MSEFSAGDTAWVLVSAAMVFIMTPALGFFYGGMVRSKNVLNIIMQCLFIAGIISVEWVLCGYTMAFGDDVSGLIGNFDKAGLMNIGYNVLDGTAIPELAFVAFQCMFAILTPALIIGAFAERMRFPALVLFSVLWAMFLYNPMAHWVWGGGFLSQLGALDFAGGLVIHILSGVSGLTVCILLGKRRGFGKTAMLPHNMPMVVMGASLLWFGWFGFNAGSALGANELAANAFVVTQAAAAAGLVGWVLVEWFRDGKPTVLGAASGCIAGLVAITPAAGFVAPLPSVIIGLVGGVVCYYAVAFGVHGIGGTWGSIATGLWATTEINPDGANGLFYGDTDLIIAQLISTVVAYVLAIAGSFVIYKIVDALIGARVAPKSEVAGLDSSEHGQSAYINPLLGGSLLSFDSGEKPMFK